MPSTADLAKRDADKEYVEFVARLKKCRGALLTAWSLEDAMIKEIHEYAGNLLMVEETRDNAMRETEDLPNIENLLRHLRLLKEKQWRTHWDSIYGI